MVGARRRRSAAMLPALAMVSGEGIGESWWWGGGVVARVVLLEYGVCVCVTSWPSEGVALVTLMGFLSLSLSHTAPLLPPYRPTWASCAASCMRS